MGLTRHQPDYGQPKNTLIGRLWAGLSLLGAIPAFAAMALLEGEGSGDGSGDGAKPPGDGGSGAAGGSAGAGQPFRTFATQKDHDDHAAGIKREAERNAMKTVAEQLGCTVEEAKKILADRAAAEAAQLTEVERREKAAADKEAAAAVRESAAAKKALKADVSLALTGAQVKADRLIYALNAAMDSLPDDADEAAIADKVKAVKEAIPEFFGASEPGKPPAPNLGGAPRNNGSNGGQPTGMEAGRERARLAREGRKSPEGTDPFAGLGRAVG